MIFYYNADGRLLSAVFDEVYQGSNKANTIYFACPTARSNTVNVAFTLPDGTSTARHVMTIQGAEGLNGVYNASGQSFNVWKYDVPTLITEKKGTVTVQFYINEVGATVATAAVEFYVNKGVSGIVPEIGDSYSELVSLVSEHSGRLDAAEDELDGKLDIKTSESDYSAVYGYNQSEQAEFKVDTAATAGQIPLYNINANLSTGTPVAATDAASKGYVDTNYGKTVEFSVDNSTYVLTVTLKNASGTAISYDTVDLPIESVVVGGEYDNNSKSLILTLKSGSTITVPVSGLISGLQSTLSAGNGISIVSDTVSTTCNGGTFSVLSTDWANNSVTVNITGLGANDKIDVGAVAYTDQEKINEAQLFVTASTGSITITAQTTPSATINFQYFITKGVA